MFRSKTVFVLGAGASAEVGLPLGVKLLGSICSLIDIKYDHSAQTQGDRMISDAMKLILNEGQDVTQYNEHLKSAWQIAKSSQQGLSIDNIVDGLEDKRVELMAKLGIVRAIQLSEEKSTFFSPATGDITSLDFGRFSSTWFDKFTKLICENRRRSGLERAFENISIISFNYDRCIEAYLPRSIANYYGVDVQEVLPQFLRMPILRPYGIAGKINWGHNGALIGFGGDSAQYLADSSQMIRTFSEQIDDNASVAEIKTTLSEARQIVFLGSAFHRQNLKILEAEIDPNAKVLCTASGVSDGDLKVVKSEIASVFSTQERRIDFAKLHCNQFFENYWRTLTS